MNKISFAKSISGRLFLLCLVPALLALGIVVFLGAREAYSSLGAVERRLLNASALGAATELSTRNDRWNNVANMMAMAQQDGMFGHRKDSNEFTKSIVEAFPLIVGAYIAYEPNADTFDASSIAKADDGVARESMDQNGRFVPYFFSQGEGNSTIGLRPRIGMETMEFYLGPRDQFTRSAKTTPVVCEPFLKGGVLMVSHACPIVIGGQVRRSHRRRSQPRGTDRDCQ
jgi:hypothetical protein